MSQQDHHAGGPDGQTSAARSFNDDDGDKDLGFSPEAILHFRQFSAQQYMPEYYFLGSNASSTSQPLGAAPLLSELSSNSGGSYPALGGQTSMTIAPGQQTQPLAAQWSADNLNPFVPNFVDAELVREPLGTSVLEEGSVLGESGRTYHSYKADTSAYLLPNDPAEQDRLDLQHAMVTHCWDGRLLFAPLPRAPKLVLDVATGTGIWALEFARANPTSFVVGTDLSKIQPVPDIPNCLFEKMDCEDDWMWTYKYDFIHIRYIVSAIRDPQRLIQQAFEHLNQGGWLEMGDIDWDLLSEEGLDEDDRVATCYFKQWCDLCGTGAATNGVDVHKAQKYKRWMIETGFTEVYEEIYKVPYTPWPEEPKAKQAGRWMQANILSGLRGVAFKMLRSVGMAPEEIDSFIEKTRDEVKYGNIRGYTPLYKVYGKRPSTNA